MSLSRRALLRGAGGLAVGLPALEALSPRPARAGPAAPRRFVGLYHPNGVLVDQWFPTEVTSETAFTFREVHQALVPWKAHLLLTGGIDLQVAVTGPGEQHQRGLGALLTGARLDVGSFVGNDGTRAGYALGPSIDQLLVPILGGGTPVKSLQLGVHALRPDVSGVLSYAGPGAPLFPQSNPHLTFQSLFLDAGATPDALTALRARRRSVLDGVQAQLQALQRRVSTADRRRLDEHLTLIRELEGRLTGLPAGSCAAPLDPGAVSYDTEASIPVVAQLQLDLLLLAFRCDLTRVATVMFSDALNHIALPHLGIAGDVHNLTHALDPLVARRDAWQATMLATLLAGLEVIVDADGATALQHTQVLWGSDVSRGELHSHADMPLVLAGHGAGFRLGRYARWNSVPHNDLLLAIVNGLGGHLTTLGDPAFSRGPLGNLS